jgi:hypothetical protein
MLFTMTHGRDVDAAEDFPKKKMVWKSFQVHARSGSGRANASCSISSSFIASG